MLNLKLNFKILIANLVLVQNLDFRSQHLEHLIGM